MGNFRPRFLASFTPGVRILVCLLTAAYLADVLGKSIGAYALADWLALSGPEFWSGQFWRLVTYALLPAGIMDFAMNIIALVMLGGMIERIWSRGELWRYCIVAAAGAGVAKVLLQSSVPLALTGAAPMIFGLLIAWGFLCGYERISIVVFGETTVWKLVLIASSISLTVMFLTSGSATAMILAAGGGAGFLYLWLQRKRLMSRPGCVAHSDRISRLEL